MKIDIPNHGHLELTTLLIDYNGTIAKSGQLMANMMNRLLELSKTYKIYVITGDTYGNVQEAFKNTNIDLLLAYTADEKMTHTIRLGADRIIAIGNGNIDYKMFMQAKLSFCVIGDEGASYKAMSHADIIVKDINHVFDMLEDPKKIIATLKE